MLKKALDFLKYSKKQRGAAAVEYGIMVALIAAVIVATVKTIGSSLLSAFTTVATAIGAA